MPSTHHAQHGQHIQIVAVNNTDRTVTIAIDQNLYEYEIGDGYEQALESFRTTFKYSPGHALNYIKRRALSYKKISQRVLV